jgi:hypothetical protein
VRFLGFALLLAIVLAGCGDDFASVGSRNPRSVSDGLTFTRADGSSYAVKEAVARCTPSGDTGTEYVYVTDPTGSSTFFLRVALGVDGERQLPLRTPGDQHDLTLVATDPQNGAHLDATNRAQGELTITEATCDPEPRLSFRIDARLAPPSGGPVKVHGGLASVTGEG